MRMKVGEAAISNLGHSRWCQPQMADLIVFDTANSCNGLKIILCEFFINGEGKGLCRGAEFNI